MLFFGKAIRYVLRLIDLYVCLKYVKWRLSFQNWNDLFFRFGKKSLKKEKKMKKVTHTHNQPIKKRFFIEKFTHSKHVFNIHIEKIKGMKTNKQTNNHRMLQTNRTAQLAVKNSNQKMTSNNLFEDMP